MEKPSLHLTMATTSAANCDTMPKPECRVCLKNDGAFPIFGDQTKPDISMEIEIFGGIQLQVNDELTKFICEDCFKNLEVAITFRRMAKRADMLLKRRRKEAFVNIPTTDNILVNVSNDLEHSYDDAESNIQSETFNCKYCNVVFLCPDKLEEHKSTVQHKRNYILSFLPKKGRVESKKPGLPKGHKACDICKKIFTKLRYPRHMFSEHNIKVDTNYPTTAPQKECPECKKVFHPSGLSNHMKKIHGMEYKVEKDTTPKVKTECPICKKKISAQLFSMHMMRHNNIENKKYVCDQCGRKFAFQSSFKTHCLVHTNEYPFKCDYCPYKARTKGLLKIHTRTHTGDYPYMCTQCGTRYLTKSNLNWHLRRHRGPVDFVCSTCKMGFYSKLQLERHVAVSHNGEKNHVCTFCGAAFGYRNGLMCHLRKVHQRPDTNVCGVCNKGFYSKIQLERHTSIMHNGEKNHVCTFCGSAFGYRNSLMRHLRRVHKRRDEKAVEKQKILTDLVPAALPEIQNKPPEPIPMYSMQMTAPTPTYINQNFVTFPGPRY